ncbi:MAG: hypothetical protein ACLFQS_04315, partial [Bacteroidales bacterium]
SSCVSKILSWLGLYPHLQIIVTELIFLDTNRNQFQLYSPPNPTERLPISVDFIKNSYDFKDLEQIQGTNK